MMSDITETVQCTNCNIEILSSNYLIHSLYCQRNFYFCSKCQCPVNYNQEVEHNETSHVLIHCVNCKKELENYALNEHLEKHCAFRKVKCHICDIEINATDIIEHEDYCGCRTERCLECNEFVMLKYKPLHVESNHNLLKLSDELGPSPSWQNGRRTLCNFMPDYISKQKKPASHHGRKTFEGHKKKSYSSVHEFKVEEDWPLLPSLRSLQISERNLESIGFEVDNNLKGGAHKGSDILQAVQYSKKVNCTGQTNSVFKQSENLKDSLIFDNSNFKVNSTKQCSKCCENMALADETILEKNKYDLPVKEITNAKLLTRKMLPLTGNSAIEVHYDMTGNQFVHQSRSKTKSEKNQSRENCEVDSNATHQKTLSEKEIVTDSFSEYKEVNCNCEKLPKISKNDFEICDEDLKQISSKRKVVKTQLSKKKRRAPSTPKQENCL